MKLSELPFGQKFYWKGKKWKAVIAPKNPSKKTYQIMCAEYPQGPWVKMPSGRKVKPVIKAPIDVNQIGA